MDYLWIGMIGVGCVKVFRYYYLMLPRQKTVSPIHPLLPNDGGNPLNGVYKSRTQFERDKQDLICEILSQNRSKLQLEIRMKEKDDPSSRAYHEQPFIKLRQHLRYPQQTNTQDKGYLPNRQRAKCPPAEQEPTYFGQYIGGLKQRQDYYLLKTEYPQTGSDGSFQFISHFIKTPKPQAQKITVSSVNQSKAPLNDNQSTAMISKYYHSSRHPTRLRKTQTSSQLGKTHINETSNNQITNMPTVQQQIRKFALQQRTDHSAEKTIIQTGNRAEERPSISELTINRYEKTVKSPKISLQMALEDKISNVLKQEAPAAQQRDKESSQVYNYDQQSNIFTKFPQRTQKSPQQQISKSVKQVKLIFKIRDEERFKRELKQEEERLNKIDLKKKPKSDIFDGCAQLTYRKYFSRQNSTPPRQQAITNQPQSKNLPAISHKNSEPIKYTEQKQGALGSKPNPAIPKSSSDGGSSVGSFMQEKQQATQKQVEGISDMVSSAVQAVASNIRRLINKDAEMLPQREIIKQQKDKEIADPAPQLKDIPSGPIRPGQRSIKPQSMSKVFGVAAEKKVQQSIDFFANLPPEMQSNNSTIKQASSKSEDRSQVMMQLRELQSYSIDSQVFKKDAANHIPQIDIAPSHRQKQIQRSKSLEMTDEAYQPIFASISQYRPSHQATNNLQEIELSQDAFSLSKFADAADSNLGPSIFQISFEKPKKQPTANGKVKRIEIDLDSDSFEEQPNGSFQLADDEGDVDLDDLQDYESDEQPQQIPTQHKRVKGPFPKALAPVLEEDLEESQYSKLQKKKSSLKQASK